MKRHGNLFERIAAPENLRLAWLDARRGKSLQRAVQRFEANAEANLDWIRRLLLAGRFATAPYKTMWISVPKRREIHKLPFSPDRIVHHAIIRIVGPIWSAMFIADSYACLPGRGLHGGSRRTMEFARRFRYCLKMDIRKFYPSVDHDTLYGIVCRKIKCPATLRLLREIIYSIPGGKGVPIGNYTSQWFGNLYLNELDTWLKQDRKVKAYLRYCDDFCLFSDDKRELRRLADEIETFLQEKLKLTLSKRDVFPVAQGVDFLGYRHFADHVLLRKSTATRMKRRLRTLPALLEAGKITADQFRSTLASVSGWLRWADTHHLRLRLRMTELGELLTNGNPGHQAEAV
jgi:retron-type reverse transcriptase